MNHFIKNGRNVGRTSKYMEIQSKGLDTDYLNVFENAFIYNKERDEHIDFVYNSKGENGSIFINNDGVNCDFISKDNLFPELQNLNTETTTADNTDFKGQLVADDFILRDGTNLKDYIDQQIAIVYASVGGTLNTLTSGTIEEDIAP